MTNIVAIIPAYNEEDALADVISKTFNHVDKVIVVNDGAHHLVLVKVEGFCDGLDNLHEDAPDLFGNCQFHRGLRHITEHATDGLV